MGKLKTPGNQSREETEGAAHIAPVPDAKKGEPSEHQVPDIDRKADTEEEMEGNDAYPR